MTTCKGKRYGIEVLIVLFAACDDVLRPSPTPTALVLYPASAVLQIGGTQSFLSTAQFSDGMTTPGMVLYRASGGVITDAGDYTAGQAAGTFRVIATQIGGRLADTAVITIINPISDPRVPSPAGGAIFFTGDAENGDLGAWTLPWGVVQQGGTVTASSARAKTGSWSYKYEVTHSGSSGIGHDVRTMSGGPHASMGGPNGRYMSGYYSWWFYLEEGYNSPAENGAWNLLMGWMTGVNSYPTPISNIALENRTGYPQLVFVLKNCTTGQYTCPEIPGYRLDHGWYFMTPGSPAGIKPFPRNQWVHVSVFYKMAPTNGVVTIWQDGIKIYDLTAPAMNTFGGWVTNGPGPVLTNIAGDMLLQFGDYGGHQDGVQRFYMDDFMVTDYRVAP